MRWRNLSLVAVAAGASVALTGCGGLVGPEKEATSTYDVSGQVSALRVHTGSGDVQVVESARSGVHVTEYVHWRGGGGRPQTAHPLEDGTLTLTSGCHNCSVDYKVEVPRGLDVKADSGSGAIILNALTGPVDVSTGSGDIDAKGLAGHKVDADTGSGDVKLRFTAIPDDVTARTGSGDGIVHVPQGSYNVTVDSGSGAHEVKVTKDPSSPHKIVVRTGSGDARILPG